MTVHVEHVSWGALSSVPLIADWAATFEDAIVDPTYKAEHIAVFCRVTCSTDSAQLVSLLLARPGANWDGATLSSVRTILQSRLDTPVAFMSKESTGFASVEATAGSPREILAAAAAMSRVSGSWDESPVIVIEVANESFEVRPAFDGQRSTMHVSSCVARAQDSGDLGRVLDRVRDWWFDLDLLRDPIPGDVDIWLTRSRRHAQRRSGEVRTLAVRDVQSMHVDDRARVGIYALSDLDYVAASSTLVVTSGVALRIELRVENLDITAIDGVRRYPTVRWPAGRRERAARWIRRARGFFGR